MQASTTVTTNPAAQTPAPSPAESTKVKVTTTPAPAKDSLVSASKTEAQTPGPFSRFSGWVSSFFVGGNDAPDAEGPVDTAAPAAKVEVKTDSPQPAPAATVAAPAARVSVETSTQRKWWDVCGIPTTIANALKSIGAAIWYALSLKWMYPNKEEPKQPETKTLAAGVSGNVKAEVAKTPNGVQAGIKGDVGVKGEKTPVTNSAAK